MGARHISCPGGRPLSAPVASSTRWLAAAMTASLAFSVVTSTSARAEPAPPPEPVPSTAGDPVDTADPAWEPEFTEPRPAEIPAAPVPAPAEPVAPTPTNIPEAQAPNEAATIEEPPGTPIEESTAAPEPEVAPSERGTESSAPVPEPSAPSEAAEAPAEGLPSPGLTPEQPPATPVPTTTPTPSPSAPSSPAATVRTPRVPAERPVPKKGERTRVERPKKDRQPRRAPEKRSGRDQGSRAERVLKIASDLSGIPYVWGGTTTRGFDCSGYARHVYAKAGVRLPRTAAQQQRATRRVHDPKPGDLVFFGTPAHHVGIYAGKGRMYDAPRTGRTTGLHRIWSSRVTYGRP